jgi:DDE superfamily endonuclease
MPTFEITIYIEYRNTSLTNLSLLMSLAAMEGLDIGVGVGLRRGPVQVTKFGRGKRWHILPAYAQDGIMLRRVYQGSTDSDLFEDFIAQLLHHCGRYPEPKSVIIMDNASWHYSEKILQICRDAQTKPLVASLIRIFAGSNLEIKQLN